MGGQEKEWMGCFLDNINADQWTTAVRDEGEWRKTAEQGAGRFMAKWIAADKVGAGLRHAAVCPNVTGRTKDRMAQSKRVRAGSLAVVDQLWSHVCFISCFVSFSSLCFHRSCGPSLDRSSVCMRPDSPTQLPNCVLFCFVFFRDVAFPEYFCTIAVSSLYGE